MNLEKLINDKEIVSLIDEMECLRFNELIKQSSIYYRFQYTISKNGFEKKFEIEFRTNAPKLYHLAVDIYMVSGVKVISPNTEYTLASFRRSNDEINDELLEKVKEHIYHKLLTIPSFRLRFITGQMNVYFENEKVEYLNKKSSH